MATVKGRKHKVAVLSVLGETMTRQTPSFSVSGRIDGINFVFKQLFQTRPVPTTSIDLSLYNANITGRNEIR